MQHRSSAGAGTAMNVAVECIAAWPAASLTLGPVESAARASVTVCARTVTKTEGVAKTCTPGATSKETVYRFRCSGPVSAR